MSSQNNYDLILWIQNWYYQYCDGDWEHDERFVIRNVDNPGWRVTINLEGSHCEGKIFDNIDIENTEENWYHCFLRDGKFEAAGGPCNLIDVLTIFQKWAKRCQELP